MCKICRDEIKGNEKYLDCSGCPNVEIIPSKLKNLKRLICFNCKNLKDIQINKLEYLDCSRCPRLKFIPYLCGIKEIICYRCDLLITIDFKNITLKYLDCYGCDSLMVISKNFNLKELHCSDCSNLHEIPEQCDFIFRSNCEKLIVS
jgi:hypothetical protein